MISRYFERGYSVDGAYYEFSEVRFCGIPISRRRILDTLSTKEEEEEAAENEPKLGFDAE